jgi:hypothetical protein
MVGDFDSSSVDNRNPISISKLNTNNYSSHKFATQNIYVPTPR